MSWGGSFVACQTIEILHLKLGKLFNFIFLYFGVVYFSCAINGYDLGYHDHAELR